MTAKNFKLGSNDIEPLDPEGRRRLTEIIGAPLHGRSGGTERMLSSDSGMHYPADLHRTGICCMNVSDRSD